MGAGLPKDPPGRPAIRITGRLFRFGNRSDNCLASFCICLASPFIKFISITFFQ
jgi:hypothetical protein